MSDKKDNIVSQALIDMDKITKSIKEESKNTLKSMLSETIKDVIRESVKDNGEEDDDMEIVNNDNENDIDTSKNSDNNTEVSDTTTDDSNGHESLSTSGSNTNDAGEEGAESESDSDSTPKGEEESDSMNDDDDWSEFDKYKVDDNTYDLTGVKDYDEVVKVYKKLKDDDEVVVKKDDNKISLSDKGTGAEYVIELGDDSSDKSEADAINEDEFEDISFDLSDDNEDEDSDDSDDIAGIPDINEKKCKKGMKKERIFEIDLGYTDNYQDKDPLSGLSNTEPSKSGKSLDKGIPTGTKKPWPGNTADKGKPFGGKIDECGTTEVKEDAPVDEGTNVTLPNSRKKVKSHTPDTEKKNYPKVHHHDSVAGEYTAMNESLKKENDMLKKEIQSFKKTMNILKENLNEAYVTNVNLGKITKLFLENTTSKNEKIYIVNRFSNEAKTIEDSNKLYESLSKELANKKTTKSITESKIVSENKNTKSNEYRSKDLLETIDLMNRIMKY